ncbi:hypothetical protein QJQ45_000687 [Haematococcus lacustris]|nr:hypothetical protein QJQ45_000687 [Haematococcus lacustris]
MYVARFCASVSPGSPGPEQHFLVVAVDVLLMTGYLCCHSAFPWCVCNDYAPASSPWAVRLEGTSNTTAALSATFVIESAAPLSVAPSQCRSILTQRIEKIELQSSYSCLGVVYVYINGMASPASGASVPANSRSVANIKVKFNPTLAPPGSGTTFTIVGIGACNSWESLFATPGPAFRYSVFNWGSGTRDTFDTPVTWQLTNTTTDPTGTAVVTGVFSSTGCDVASPCCNMAANKIEFHVGDACRSSVESITVGGRRWSPSFQSFGTGRLVFKITGMGLNWYEVEGVTVTFRLRRTAACPTLNSFLAQPLVAISDHSLKCCPVFTLNV